MSNIDKATFPVELDQCSHQVQTLWALVPEYQLQVRKLWADTNDEPGPRELQRRGYSYLVTLFYEIPKRGYVDNKPHSMEFHDLIFFCRYVGPRPTLKHSLHRMDNSRGYCIGNVEWADKRKQAEVRRNTQLHYYLGRRLTDRQLAELLTTKGHHTTAGAIKKFRQRQKHRGVMPSEITRTIFKKIGLPYESSADPLEAWDFPEEFHEKLTYAYQAYRYKGETRIEYFIRWLTEMADKYLKLFHNPLTHSSQKMKLAEAEFRYRALANMIWGEKKALHSKMVKTVVGEIVEGWTSTSLEKFHPQPQLLPNVISCPTAQPAASSNPAVNLPGLKELDDVFMAGMAEGKALSVITYELFGLPTPPDGT